MRLFQFSYEKGRRSDESKQKTKDGEKQQECRQIFPNPPNHPGQFVVWTGAWDMHIDTQMFVLLTLSSNPTMSDFWDPETRSPLPAMHTYIL